MDLKEWLNSINMTKKNLIDDDPPLEKDYIPYVINKCLFGEIDCILFVNEMNIYSFLPKKMQYDFYINAIRKRKRFSPPISKDKIENLEIVKQYYGYSTEKAEESLKILTEDQIMCIRKKLNVGGRK